MSSRPSAVRGKELTEQARKAEALGYSSFFVPDHFVDHDLAPTVALAHVAAVTDTLRVGPLVLGNDYKHPVVLAREMATLDLLSDGRLELGIGAGWMTADYEKAGIPLDRPGVRIARLAESITILKGLFAPGPFTFHGEHYQVTELDGMPKPRAGREPAVPHRRRRARRSSALAAREAKIVGINANLRSGEGESRETAQSLLPEATDQKLAWLREAAGDGVRRSRDPVAARVRARHRRPVGDRRRRWPTRSACRRPTRVLAPATLVGSVDEHRRAARGAARALADVVHRGADRVDRNAGAGRRAPGGKVGDA